MGKTVVNSNGELDWIYDDAKINWNELAKMWQFIQSIK